MGRVLRLMAVAIVLLGIPAASPAAAQGDGACVAFFNGVPVDQIDGIDSPLELQADDVLVFHGSDDPGTGSAEMALGVLSITLDRNAAVYGPVTREFSVELDLEEFSPYGVGLYWVEGSTDNCTARAWIRIGGRHPFATLAGLTAAGLAIAGFAAQLAAIASRRRWSPLVAALAGIATGIGGAVIGQQFGRLQPSWPVIAACAGGAALLGAGLAALLRPRRDERIRRKRRDAAASERALRYQARLEAARLDAARREEEARRNAQGPPSHTPDAAPRAASAAAAEDAAAGLPYWCYVMTDVEVLALDDHTRTVGTLRPGTWYLAKREVGGWAQIAVANGTDGWVPAASVNRHG